MTKESLNKKLKSLQRKVDRYYADIDLIDSEIKISNEMGFNEMTMWDYDIETAYRAEEKLNQIKETLDGFGYTIKDRKVVRK